VKKKTTKEIIEKITEIRMYNNQRWMQILQLALAARPKKAKEIMRIIVGNDKEITKWTSRL
jgi:hypothetical protein